MLVKTTLKEDGTTVESESRGLTVRYNTQDRTVGMNPGELLLSALGGCMTGIASEMAGEFGIDLKAFSVDVEGISAADHRRPGFAEIHTTIHMTADCTPEKRRNSWLRSNRSARSVMSWPMAATSTIRSI